MATTIVSSLKRAKHKVWGMIFGTHDGVVADRELYYKNSRLFYGRSKIVNNATIIEEVEVANIEDINALLQSQRLHFSLYPFESKDNWFRFHGECIPAFIGFNFKIIELRVGVLNTVALATGDNSVQDKMGSLASPVVVPEAASVSSIITKTVADFPNNLYPANSVVGVFFNGKVTTGPRQIQLKVNSGTVISINMEIEGQVTEGEGLGSPLNKLYVAEVVIETTNATPTPINQEV